ncbi:hypothetical protein ElyMa_004807600 [Elysia marginata]|uniref:Uncharacterized protein n=1 Tax=Elysia marginata TaxID=1093978 RepID=A0AAV4IIU3_9GAST|nr:hypothetical protein ElyMa_004807600 [Elysia marginata]
MLHHRPTTQLLRAFNITSRHLSRSVRVARCQPQNRGANTTLTCYIFIASQASQHSSCSSLFLDFCGSAQRAHPADLVCGACVRFMLIASQFALFSAYSAV